MKPMMKCGHRANALLADNDRPCCVICAPSALSFQIDTDFPDISNREARCYCGKIAKSTDDLAFFEYRGPGSEVAKRRCVKCGYYDTAHKKPSTNSQICNTFMNDPNGMEYDSYYCGCRGWD